MHFSRIRVSGFKSFVDPTELHIEDGLTGIVGPNGCGKSNLLESIRWVMGENRVKNMRGSGMDDVIFAGTNARPARNLADVTLTLDNSDRKAPSAFNEDDILEVSRRIERESGSAYRVNGREVRAKDVQLLFADAATGAHSPALVSQGRIGAMINAKPQDRRALLEEAAGISGLHARRKEAESRLRSAEGNLVRLDDVMVQMDGQIAGLKRQARQATRYRNISGDIERALGLLLYVRWKAAADQEQGLDGELTSALAEVARLTEIQTGLSTEQTELASKLPDLRQKEAEAAAAVHRITIAREQLEEEETRLQNQKAELELRLQQVAQDCLREEDIVSDAATALTRLTAEQQELSAALEAESDAESKAKAQLNAIAQEASAVEEALDKLNARVAAGEARRDTLELEVSATERRSARLNLELERLTGELGELAQSDEVGRAITEAENGRDSAEAALADARRIAENAAGEHTAARDRRDTAHEGLSEVRTALSELQAEARALNDLITSTAQSDGEPVSDALKVSSGYETALGAALGDDLDAPEGKSGARYWRALPDFKDAPALPEGAVPLSDLVKAPKSLARRLGQIGVVDQADGARLAAKLNPGQKLVTREGALWRWDGFVTAADAPSLAAVRIAQKNRLQELSVEIGEVEARCDALNEAYESAVAALLTAREADQLARTRRNDAEEALTLAISQIADMEREAGQRSSRAEALDEARERLKKDLEESVEAHRLASESFAGLENSDQLRGDVQKLRVTVGEKRAALADARAQYDGLRRESDDRRRRLESLSMEVSAWESRATSGKHQLDELLSRQAEIKEALAGISTDPRQFEAQRKRLIEELDQAEWRRQDAADGLANAESILAEKDREIRELQDKLAVTRENKVRVETSLEATRDRRETIAREIGDEFQCPPSHLLEKINHKDPENLPLLEVIEKRLDRLKAERERLGAVNLRAAEELEELAQQVENLESEKADLVSAIARLRHAIGSLNREGRERLLAAFEGVNAHFGDLFTTLFGGGEAHLKLTESDDPLAAGLEIYASPPGKKLQHLSLLSGGEQALTALSLIFAVFMTNPAPICVLDEVDAPLDDANVERFCDLLDEMTKRTDTRFLIVTHNAISMARMDRLFGVTMAERGVSQLVSVDLAGADRLLAAE